jgi:hypothetical protein
VDYKPVRASNRIVLPVDGDLTSAAGCRSVFVLASFEPDEALRDREEQFPATRHRIFADYARHQMHLEYARNGA